jgi:hypothetical protein
LLFHTLIITLFIPEVNPQDWEILGRIIGSFVEFRRQGFLNRNRYSETANFSLFLGAPSFKKRYNLGAFLLKNGESVWKNHEKR